MAIALPQQVYNQFKGIREINGVASGGQISALSAYNVEFFNSDIGGGVGIRTTTGSKVFATLPTGFKALKCFSSIQSGTEYLFVYAENTEKGVLYRYNNGSWETQIDSLPLTGEANGITIQYGFVTPKDLLVFTNGKKKYSVCIADSPQNVEIETDFDFLSMTYWNGFLVVGTDTGVYASHKNDIYTWGETVTSQNASVASWDIQFGRKVTAVASFATGLFMFTDRDISHINGSPNLTTSVFSSVAMNGCFSYESLCVHGTYLFFYDDLQKNIFYIQQTDTGQTRPTGPVAQEIQSFFNGTINRFKMYSCVYSTNNEIWLIVNNKTIIFDYQQMEFVERRQTAINDICMRSNLVYSVNDAGEVRQEKIDSHMSGDYHEAEYKTSFINMGSNTNLKKQKTPVLLVLNSNHVNDFFVQITADYKEKTAKHIVLKPGEQGIYAEDGLSVYPLYNLYGDDSAEDEDDWVANAYYSDEDPTKKTVVEISTPQTWYTLGIKIFTDEDYQGQGFSIESMEIKRLKEKTKTKGR